MTLIKDTKERSIYVVAKNDHHLLAAGTMLGGFGGGAMVPANPSTLTNLPFGLPQGDRTPVRLELRSMKDGKEMKLIQLDGDTGPLGWVTEEDSNQQMLQPTPWDIRLSKR